MVCCEERRARQPVGELTRVRLSELHRIRGLERAVLCEVAALRDAPAVDCGQARGEVAWLEDGDDVPVVRGDERHPLALALDDEPRRYRLDSARRQSLHHLAPEDRRDLVAIEAVEDATRLLRVDERLVDVAGLAQRALD